MREKTIKLYKYDELPTEKAKERARDWYREGALEYDWWEFVYEDFERIATALGYTIGERSQTYVNAITHETKTRTEKKIWFSGFCSPGDGACFEGSWSAADMSMKTLRAQLGDLSKHPDKELVRIAYGLQDLARKHKKLTATLTHTDRYYYAKTVHIDCEELKMVKGREEDVVTSETIGELCEYSWSLMNWLFSNLREEHDYRLSDEAIVEGIKANEYEFNEDGERED